jgi:predicted DNA-binding protein YlxM (UPF0122 family)
MKRIEKITRLYMSGVPVTDISEMFNITREAVYQKLRRLEGWEGMKTHHAKRRAKERLRALREHSEEIVSGWLAGVTMADLAKEFGTSRKNISVIIKEKMGSTRRNYQRDLKIAEEYKAGVTQAELSREYNISQPCISRIVNTLCEDEE